MGDIHGNYPALRAIEEAVTVDRFDLVVNTGDFTVFGPFPNETIGWFREREKSLCIRGNTDRKVLALLRGEGVEKPRKAEKRVMYFWTSETLLPENVEYLKSLPDRMVFTAGDVSIGLFHGTERNENEALFPDAPEKRFRKLAKGSQYRVHIMGHSHVPYYKVVDDVHFINPGSVGRMFDGDPRASFATLTISRGKIAVRHRRIHYAVGEVVEALRKNGLPEIYGEMYRRGKKLN